jgi:hypothetical protein
LRSDAVKEPFKPDLIRNIYHVLGSPEIDDILVNPAEEVEIEVADSERKIKHCPGFFLADLLRPHLKTPSCGRG